MSLSYKTESFKDGEFSTWARVNRRTLVAAALGAAATFRSAHTGTARQASPATPAPPALTVGTYASPDPGSVNLHWVQTPDGLVVIDGLRTIRDAQDAVREMERLDQPVLAIFVTHAHPDHVGGLGVLRDAFGPIPIYAEQETIDILEEDRGGLLALAREVPGDDYPDEIVLPDHPVANGEEVVLGGVGFRVHLLGPGEGAAMAVVHVPDADALFTGDIVNHEMTPVLFEGQTAEWIDQLLLLAAEYMDVGTVYPGHGSPGPHSIIAQQMGYLTSIRHLVGRRQTSDGILAPADNADVLEEIDDLYPGYQPVASLAELTEMNPAAVAMELFEEESLPT